MLADNTADDLSVQVSYPPLGCSALADLPVKCVGPSWALAGCHSLRRHSLCQLRPEAFWSLLSGEARLGARPGDVRYMQSVYTRAVFFNR